MGLREEEVCSSSGRAQRTKPKPDKGMEHIRGEFIVGEVDDEKRGNPGFGRSSRVPAAEQEAGASPIHTNR